MGAGTGHEITSKKGGEKVDNLPYVILPVVAVVAILIFGKKIKRFVYFEKKHFHVVILIEGGQTTAFGSQCYVPRDKKSYCSKPYLASVLLVSVEKIIFYSIW